MCTTQKCTNGSMQIETQRRCSNKWPRWLFTTDLMNRLNIHQEDSIATESPDIGLKACKKLWLLRVHGSLYCIEKVLHVALGLMAGLKEPPLPLRLSRCAPLSPAELSEGHWLSWVPSHPWLQLSIKGTNLHLLCCSAAGLLARWTPVHPVSLRVVDVQLIPHAKKYLQKHM